MDYDKSDFFAYTTYTFEKCHPVFQKEILAELTRIYEEKRNIYYKNTLLHPLNLDVSKNDNVVTIHQKHLNMTVHCGGTIYTSENKKHALTALKDRILKQCKPFDLENAIKGEPVILIDKMMVGELSEPVFNDDVYLFSYSHGLDIKASERDFTEIKGCELWEKLMMFTIIQK